MSSLLVITNEMQEQFPRQIKYQFYEKYELHYILGQGSYGTVRLASCRQTNKKYAVKCVLRQDLNDSSLNDLQTEIQILLTLKHPHIINLREIFDDDSTFFFMVMELATGGELFERIVQKAVYTEEEARHVISTVASTLAYMHDKGIVHRDLKPENFVYADEQNDSPLKLIDFGFSSLIKDQNQQLSDTCGTPGYFAPEVLKQEPYRFSCDIWSLGVIMYILLSGEQPFYDPNPDEEVQRILNGEYIFPSYAFNDISIDAMNLIERMLQVDPKQRITAREIVQHPWCRGTIDNPPRLNYAVTGITSILAKRRWKLAIHATRAISRAKLFVESRRSFEEKQREPKLETSPISTPTSLCSFQSDFSWRSSSLSSLSSCQSVYVLKRKSSKADSISTPIGTPQSNLQKSGSFSQFTYTDFQHDEMINISEMKLTNDDVYNAFCQAMKKALDTKIQEKQFLSTV